MWTREEIARAHQIGAGNNGARPAAVEAVSVSDGALEVATAAFALAVAAFALALYVYMSREVPKP